jgi:WD40 repeat protein
MPDFSSSRDPVEELAEEFADRYRRGEQPSLTEYTARYPQHAEAIRKLFPALLLMENLKPDGQPTGPPETGAGLVDGRPLETLGDFRILREVGRGGMGIVYEAEQVSLGRRVALKVLPSHALLDSRRLQRFQREARSAARLHHTNIVPVHGVFEAEGLHFYAMQFIQGQGLDQVLGELRQMRRGKRGAAAHEPLQIPRGQDPGCSVEELARSFLSGVFQQGLNEGEEGSGRKPVPASTRAPDADKQTPLAPPREMPPAQPAGLDPAISFSPGQGPGLSESGRQYWLSVARVGVQVANALGYASTQGVLHRDIKPSNLLLDTQGIVWVTDFGLAKAETDQDNLTGSGDIIGTLRYLAPERFTGKGDVRADLYSLGLTLYELLTLRPAFPETDRTRLLQQVLHEAPPRPRSVNPAVPRDLETIVLKAISRDPAHRYQTPAELAEDLQRFLDDRPIRARRVSELEHAWRWARRNRALSGLLAAVVVLLATVAVVATVAAVRIRGALESEKEALASAVLDRDNSTFALAHLEWEANNVAEALRLLDRCAAKQQHWEWRYLKHLCQEELFTLPRPGEQGHTGWVHSVAYSRDGRLLASGGGGNPFWGTTGEVRPGEVILQDAASGAVVRVLRGHTHVVYGVAFSHNSQRLASSSEDGTVKVWDVATGKEEHSFRTRHMMDGVAFSPDGQQVAAGSLQSDDIQVWDVPSDQAPPRTSILSFDEAAKVVFSPEGLWLAPLLSHPTYRREVRLWDRSGGKGKLQLESPCEHWGSVALSRDSRLLAAACSIGVKVWQLNENRTSGTLLHVLTGHDGGPSAVAFSPLGDCLASGGWDNTVRVWSLKSGEELRRFRGHAQRVTGLAFSPDGLRLASSSIDGTVKVLDMTFDPRTAGIPPFLQGADPPEAIAFSPDGQHFLQVGRTGTIVRLDAGNHTLPPLPWLPREGRLLPWLTPYEPACLDETGRWAGRVSRDQTVASLAETATGQERQVFRGHTVPLSHVTVSPGGRRVATGGMGSVKGGPLRGEVKVYDGASGQVLFELAEDGLFVARLALSPAGTRLALAQRIAPSRTNTLQESVLRIFDIDTGQEAQPATRHPDWLAGLAFSRDGCRLAAVGLENQLVVVRDLKTGQKTEVNQGAIEAQDVTFSPDGERLAIAGRPMVKLLDARTLEERLILRGKGQSIRSTKGFNPRVRFSPDGRHLAAITEEACVSIWSAPDPEEDQVADRLRQAERRAIGWHLTEANNWSHDPDRRLFHLEQVQGKALVSGWEYALRAQAESVLGQKEPAAADVARAVELAADDGLVLAPCTLVFERLGQWQQAAACARQALTRVPHHALAFLEHSAWLCWYTGDREGYRRIERDLLHRLGGTADPGISFHVARVCLLAPGPPSNPDLVMRLADRALKDPQLRPYNFYVKALAEFRSGRPEQADGWLKRATEEGPAEPNSDPFRWFLPAMIHQRQGRPREAREALARGRRVLEQRTSELERGIEVGRLSELLLGRIFARQAEELVEGKGS